MRASILVRGARARAQLFPVIAAVAALLLARDARATEFLDDVEAGRSAVTVCSAASHADAAAHAATLQTVLATHGPAASGFTIGATLATLDADLARGNAARSSGDRAIVAQQVRDLLAAQAEAGIGNRALCMLSGRAEPKTLERQIRLVEPRWSCEQH
jgi:hypothetical protein